MTPVFMLFCPFKKTVGMLCSEHITNPSEFVSSYRSPSSLWRLMETSKLTKGGRGILTGFTEWLN